MAFPAADGSGQSEYAHALSPHPIKRNRKIRIAGAAISGVIIIAVLVFNYNFNRTMNLFKGGEKALKTDNMIVVVRADDPAASLSDAKDYTFAVHRTSAENDGGTAMIGDPVLMRDVSRIPAIVVQNAPIT